MKRAPPRLSREDYDRRDAMIWLLRMTGTPVAELAQLFDLCAWSIGNRCRRVAGKMLRSAQLQPRVTPPWWRRLAAANALIPPPFPNGYRVDDGRREEWSEP